MFKYLISWINCAINHNLLKYLDSQVKIVGEKLIRHTRNQENFYDVKFNHTTDMKLIGKYSNGEIFTIFNEPYALMDQDLFKISQNNYSVTDNFLPKEEITLLEVTEYKNLGLLLFVTKLGILHVFGFSNHTQKFFKIQNIIHFNISDATFFENRKNLYLIVSNYKSEHYSSTVVYKFIDSHFDEIETIQTKAATKLTSVLYEFKNEKLIKIQKVDTSNPQQVLSYVYENKRYVVIFDEANSVRLYLWTENTSIDVATGKKEIFYESNNPFLLSTKNNTLLVYSLNNQFKQIHNSRFSENITKIWTFKILSRHNHTNELIILGSNIDNLVEISIVSVTIKVELLEQNIIEEDERLSKCFLDLERTVYKLRNKLDIAKNTSEDLLRETDSDETQNDLPSRKFKKLQRKYVNIKSAVDDAIINAQKLVINETVISKNPLIANKAIVNDLHFENLGNNKWKPEQWLSYSKPQNISGFVKVQFMHVNDLETIQNDVLFQDLLLTKGDLIMTGSLDMEGSQVVTFLTNPNLIKYNFNKNLEIDNLRVETINGINFENFKNGVFRIGLTDNITGNLTFVSVEAKNMSFRTLSRKANFLTTSTEQTINATIKISKILAKNVKTNTVNGLSFKNAVATFDDSFTGPASIKNIEVKNNLEMRGKVDKRFLRMNRTHIIGTNESDLLQRYNGKVTIKGNLILKNLNLGKSAKIVVSDEDFNPKIDQFWTKTTQQVIPTHFEAQNGVSAPHIFTRFVNGINVDDYMLNSTHSQKFTKFYFEDVTVRGNVVLDPNEQHSPNLKRVQEESVKINGTFVIKGRKSYLSILKIDKLVVSQLNNVDINDMIRKNDSYVKNSQNLIVKGDLHFENLIVGTINNINLSKLLENSFYVDKPQNIYEMNFKNVSVKNMRVTTLNGNRMNELILKRNKIKEFDNIDHLYVDGKITIKNVHNLSTINNLDVNNLLHGGVTRFENNTIFGSVKFLGDVKVKDFYVTIVNDVDLPTLSRRTLYKSWNQTITQHFNFTKLKSRKVKTIVTTILIIYEKIAGNLVADQINDFYVRNLIDVSSTKPQELFVPNGLRTIGLTQVQNLFAQFECDINEALKTLRNPPPQFWDHVTVTGNVTFFDKESTLSQIFDKVVTNNSDNVIFGKTTFVDHISANNITILKTINNIDILEIIQDAFVNDPELEQTVTGKKTFAHLEADDAISLQNLEVSKINNFNISEINDNIINKNFISDEPIKGKKVLFGGLQTKQIQTETLGGVKPENLVSLANANKIPSAIFDTIYVGNNFNVKFVNNMPLDVFLDERLLKNSPKQIITGNYFFRDIIINGVYKKLSPPPSSTNYFAGDVLTPQINNIQMENIVFDIGTQNIESFKKFKNDLEIIGNITVEFINGFKLSESYEKAVIKNEETSFSGSVTILAPSLMNGNITTNYINNFPMVYMLDTSTKQFLESEANQIHEITEKINDFVNEYLNMTLRIPTEYLYLEKSSDLQISVPNTIGAQIVETKDDILIHIESEEDGHFCGLPKTCKCPTQQTMQISSEHSISAFINKAAQRIYSYADDDIIVHLISNTISTSSFCRTDRTKVMNEVSSLTWNTIPRENSPGGFFLHQTFFTGYVSGVKFFTIGGRTYVVIGFYYNPVVDTHDMNCLVLRFNEDKTAIEEIQKIPTQGVKTISLIHTAQGVVLILGNEIMENVNISTKIFRFDRYKEQILSHGDTYQHSEDLGAKCHFWQPMVFDY
ncbi:uncharacterized protein BDFB_000847 [Asbolus verrucosus]|uniref:Uncharacterized protein n=1 Tax=Asbolus verrucosus TaxID=1661398 RepID=A0A482VMT7_ASBVE|nr:uncharacterized protein BDFB_000847 [Asbolus verrucosus]